MYIKRQYELATGFIADTWIIKNVNYNNTPDGQDTISGTLALYKDNISWEGGKEMICSGYFSYPITDEELVQNLILVLVGKIQAPVLDDNGVETNLIEIMEDGGEQHKIGFQSATVIN